MCGRKTAHLLETVPESGQRPEPAHIDSARNKTSSKRSASASCTPNVSLARGASPSTRHRPRSRVCKLARVERDVLASGPPGCWQTATARDPSPADNTGASILTCEYLASNPRRVAEAFERNQFEALTRRDQASLSKAGTKELRHGAGFAQSRYKPSPQR